MLAFQYKGNCVFEMFSVVSEENFSSFQFNSPRKKQCLWIVLVTL